MQHVQLKEKETLVEEGSRDSWLLLLVSGVLEAYVAGPGGRDLSVRSFGSGDIIGEAALLERSPWPMALRVAEAGSGLKLTREGLEKTLVGNPDPRGFLEVLREQHNDRDVAATVRRLRGT
jgi:CRP-like cAMP-binding protein